MVIGKTKGGCALQWRNLIGGPSFTAVQYYVASHGKETDNKYPHSHLC